MVNKEILMEGIFTDIELIDKYQRGSANEVEKREVQNRLLGDSNFRKLFDDMEVMPEGIRRSGARSSLKEKLAKLDAALEDEEESNNSVQRDVDIGNTDEKSPLKVIILWYQKPVFRAIAASVVLLVVAWFAFGPMNSVSNQELVVQYFEPYANTNPKTRGEVIEPKDITSEAFTAYDREDYAASIPLFEQAVKEAGDHLLNTFYLGNAYLEVGESDSAIKAFSTVVEAGKGLAGVAEWYLAGSYLQADMAEKAIATLINVRDHGETFYAEKANKLLNELE
ncbi:MAG: tetratricopeptide repeat protein [Bacteroidetes bacterium]|nr:tetratricopeptide repeat protein [Bacteroidota bacterium]